MSITKPWVSPTETSTKTLPLFDLNTKKFGRITDNTSLTVYQDSQSDETTPFRIGWRRSVKNGRVDTTIDKTPFEDLTAKVVTSVFVTEGIYKSVDELNNRIDVPCKVSIRVELPANGLVPEANVLEQVQLTASLVKDKTNECLLSEVRMGALNPQNEV